MENATKALLIAAAVLIAIVLIALGVNLLNAGSDTSADAENVAQQIDTAIGGQVTGIKSGLSTLNSK